MPMDVGPIGLGVLGSFVLWWDVHFLLEILGIAKRFGPLVNAKSTYTFVGLALTYAYYVHPEAESHNEVYVTFLALSAGFYLYHVWQTHRFSLLLHHVATTAVICYVLHYGDVDTATGNLAVFLLGGSLVTEPLVLLRRFLRRTHMYSGLPKLIVGWSFALSFSTVRLAGWCVQIVKYCLSPDADVVIEVLLCVIFVLSIVFSCRIMQCAIDGSL